MTGALLALDEAGVDFKVITTTGAGMVVGLIYAAPKMENPDDDWVATRRAALRGTRDWGIDDFIYDMVPINYKIFQKPGHMAEAFSQSVNPFIWSIPRESRRQRLLGDGLALMATMMSPSSLNRTSKGLCQPPPWIEMLVDFKSLETNMEKSDTKFRLSAYCVEDETERTFNRSEITVDHFKAALAMPFIYAPYKLDGKTYLEGSAFNTLELNPQDVMVESNVDTVIFFDIMGNRNLIAEPRWLIDAWGKSIIAPLTRIAERGLSDFKKSRELHAKDRIIAEMDRIMDLAESDPAEFKRQRDQLNNQRSLLELVDLLGSADRNLEDFAVDAKAYMRAMTEKGQFDQELRDLIDLALTDYTDFVRRREEFLKRRESQTGASTQFERSHSARSELLRMPFRRHIPEERWPLVLDWSYSNMSKLFDIGVETGRDFVRNHKDRLEGSLGRPVKIVETTEPSAAVA